MRKFNVHFVHSENNKREVIEDINASGIIEARVNARNIMGYLNAFDYRIEKVEEVK